jgi:hypothetical protein
MAREKKIRKTPKGKAVPPPTEQNVAESTKKATATSRKRPSAKSDESPVAKKATATNQKRPPSAKSDELPTKITRTRTRTMTYTAELPTIPKEIAFQLQFPTQVTKTGCSIPYWFPVLSIVDKAHGGCTNDFSEPIYGPTNDSNDYLHILVENLIKMNILIQKLHYHYCSSSMAAQTDSLQQSRTIYMW